MAGRFCTQIYVKFVDYLDKEYPNFDVLVLLPTLAIEGIILKSEREHIESKTNYKDRKIVKAIMSSSPHHTNGWFYFQALFLEIVTAKDEELQQKLLESIQSKSKFLVSIINQQP